MTALIYAGLSEEDKLNSLEFPQIVINGVDYTKQAQIINKEMKKFFEGDFVDYMIKNARSKQGAYSENRQIFVYLFTKRLKVSVNATAKRLKFNHATLGHSIRTVKDIMQFDKVFREKINQIETNLCNYTVTTKVFLNK